MSAATISTHDGSLDNGFRSNSDESAETLLDVTELAEGHDYCELGVTLVSPDETVLAYSVDHDGDEVYVLRFRDLATGDDLPEVESTGNYYGGAWSADSQWFFYSVHDAADVIQVWRHRLGTAVADDVLVVEEPDERFDVLPRASRSGDWVVRRPRATEPRRPGWSTPATRRLLRGPSAAGARAFATGSTPGGRTPAMTC